jgi:c-di-GMP-binding flagellar brake protein YcgR
MRFFWKRKRPRSEPSRSDGVGRSQYRARPSEGLEVNGALHLPDGRRLPAVVVDVSSSGLALRVDGQLDPGLEHGEVIELEVAITGRQPVRTPGEVVFAEEDGARFRRYGFRYVNLGNLYAQLDDVYARLFNRRGSRRAASRLDERLSLRLTWPGSWLDTHVQDLSEGGLGVFLEPAEASVLRGVDRLQASFELEGKTLEGTVHVVHRTQPRAATGFLLGLRFDLEEPGGFARHREVLARYAAERAASMARWESSWRSAG